MKEFFLNLLRVAGYVGWLASLVVCACSALNASLVDGGPWGSWAVIGVIDFIVGFATLMTIIDPGRY